MLRDLTFKGVYKSDQDHILEEFLFSDPIGLYALRQGSRVFLRVDTKRS